MRTLLVGQLHSIVTDSVKEQEFVNFVKQYQFTELTFYTGGPVETRVIPAQELGFIKLLEKVRLAGVTIVNIAIGSVIEMDRVMNFINNNDVKIDGFHLEYEWWNNTPRDFETAVNLLQYIRSKGGESRFVGAYIGWTTQEEMTALIPLVDKLYIHSYVPDGKKTYSRLKARLDQIMVAKPRVKVSVYPIFSAEWLPPEICNQGTSHPDFYNQMCFMGPWLRANGGPSGAEKAFNRSEAAGRTTKDNWRNYAVIQGFSYYSYTYLKQALE